MKKVNCALLLLISGPVMSSDQKVYLPTSKDIEVLAHQQEVIEKFLSPSDLETKYRTAPGKLGTLRAVISANVFTANQMFELQSMGVVLGDAFVLDMGFHWVVVEDEYGRDFALKYKDTSIIIFPLTMISKRVERGETVDIFDLYNGVANIVIEIEGKKPEKL